MTSTWCTPARPRRGCDSTAGSSCPAPASSPTPVRMRRVSAGSSPFVGSSSTSNSGRCMHRLRDAEPLAHALRVALHLAVDGRRRGWRGRSLRRARAAATDRRRRASASAGSSSPTGRARTRASRPAEPTRRSTLRAGLHLFAEQGRALVGPDEPDEHAHRGGLARAVRARAARRPGRLSTVKLRSFTAL